MGRGYYIYEGGRPSLAVVVDDTLPDGGSSRHQRVGEFVDERLEVSVPPKKLVCGIFIRHDLYNKNHHTSVRSSVRHQ